MRKQCPPYVVVATNLFLHNGVAFLRKTTPFKVQVKVEPILVQYLPHSTAPSSIFVYGSLRGKVLFEKMQLFQFYM